VDFHGGSETENLTAAYNQFESHLNAAVVNRFARAVKEETAGRSLVGCHYGCLFVLADTISQGRGRIMSSLTDVLDSPYIDFVAGVIAPKHWGLNSHDIYSVPFEAIGLRGKHYMLSNDHTFHVTPGVGLPWGNPVFDPDNVVRGDRYMQQRVIANAAIHGVSPHWFGLRPTWWASKPTADTIAEMTEVFNRAAALDATSLDEVALVVDHTGYDWLQDKARFLRSNSLLLYRTLQRTGAPLSTWLLTDIDKLPSRIRMVVVGFADAPRAEDLAKLRNLIAQGGRTIAVIGRPGLVDTRTGDWHPEAPAELLGLPIRLSEDREKAALVAGPEQKGIADRYREANYGSPDPWVGMGLPKEGFLSDRDLSPVPRAVVDGPSKLQFENGEGAFAERPLDGGGRLLWCSVPPLNSAIWRHWLEEAGVHFYAPLNYFVHAGKELVSITAPETGKAVIRFPEAVRVKDLFDASATGATGVLAGSAARYLQARGARVVYLGRSEEKVARALEEARRISPDCEGAVADVLDRAALETARDELLRRTGRIDVLINGAGGHVPKSNVTPSEAVDAVDIGAFDEVIRLNLQGTVLPSLVFAKVFRQQSAGTVVNFSSMAATLAITRALGYSAAKAGVENFTRWLAVELALKYGEGLRVNAVAPGFFVTAQNRSLLLGGDGLPTPRGRQVISRTPFGRFGHPEELHGAIHYLISDASRFVTGTVLPVDGGFLAYSGV